MRFLIMYLFILLTLVSFPAAAQQIDDSEDNAYVTTQDFTSFRALPSLTSERLAIIPPETTLRALGRSQRTDWIQVEYEGELGWVATWLLVWSGKVIELPIDGVNPSPFIRRTTSFGETFRETPIYHEGIDSSTRIGTIPPETQFEITGYVGSGELFWVQINYEGQLVWIGSWDIRVLDGRVRTTLNGAYRYVYGRANTQLVRDVRNSIDSLVAIERIWTQLQNGEQVPCSPLPAFVIRGTVERDIEREPIFKPVAIALDDAIAGINATISRFEDICTSDQTAVTLGDVNESLETLQQARRNITLAQALLNELSNRDPLVN